MSKYIALAEDDADDQLLFTEALKQVRGENTLMTVPNGMLMLDLLKNNKEALPDVIVLDVNMPGMTGIECLKVIRSEPEFNHLPIVIMSTTTDPRTVEAAYASGANSYAVKPGKFDDLKKIVEKIVGQDLRSLSVHRDRNKFLLLPSVAIL